MLTLTKKYMLSLVILFFTSAIAMEQSTFSKQQQRMLRQREEFKKLVTDSCLDLSGKNISYIFPRVFKDKAFQNLQAISLSRNNLKTINSETFKGLENLERLYLSGNKISSEEIEKLRDACLM